MPSCAATCLVVSTLLFSWSGTIAFPGEHNQATPLDIACPEPAGERACRDVAVERIPWEKILTDGIGKRGAE